MYTPAYNALRDIVSRRIETDFNSIPVAVVEAYLREQDEELYEKTRTTDYMRAKYMLGEEWIREDFFEWLTREDAPAKHLSTADTGQDIGLDSEYRDAIITYINSVHFHEADDGIKDHWQPVWSRVLECSSPDVEQWILQNIDKLYDIGVGVIEDCEELNTMLFIPAVGYDFMDRHWIPMYTKVFGCFEEEARAAEGESSKPITENKQ